MDRTQQLSHEALGRRGRNSSRSDCGYHSYLREGRTRVARVSAVCEESEGASGARSGYTRGGEGESELAWAGSEAANGLGVEGPRQG